MNHGTGALCPPDFKHAERYPARVDHPAGGFTVERALPYRPEWSRFYSQGGQNSCVGFGCSQVMSIINQDTYNGYWLWNRAKAMDGDPSTNPHSNDFTYLRTALDALRTEGHVRADSMTPDDYEGFEPDIANGIDENRWIVGTPVDDMRACIAAGLPVVVCCPWRDVFTIDHPRENRVWLHDESSNLGSELFGHCWIVAEARDSLQAFGLPGTYGWLENKLISYEAMEKLASAAWIEIAVVTDRGKAIQPPPTPPPPKPKPKKKPKRKRRGRKGR